MIDIPYGRLDVKVHALAYLYSEDNRNLTATMTLCKWRLAVDLSLWWVGVMLIVERNFG